MKPTLINNRWTILLPEYIADREIWSWWEVSRLAAMYETIKPGDVVFDIGAEFGDTSALWATWGASVIPFEPSPSAWPNMREIWEANHIAPPECYFVGFASDKTVENPPELEDIHRHFPVAGWPACAYGPVKTEHEFRNVTERFHDTPQIRIDDFCRKHDIYPDVMTIDVEGAELVVLEGARQVLETIKPVVFVSIHDDFMFDKFGYTSEALHIYMFGREYEGRFLGRDHEDHWLFRARS